MQLGPFNSILDPNCCDFFIAGFPLPNRDREPGENVMRCVPRQLWRTRFVQVAELHEKMGDWGEGPKTRRRDAWRLFPDAPPIVSS